MKTIEGYGENISDAILPESDFSFVNSSKGILKQLIRVPLQQGS